jgi:hypothetical protein
MEKAIWFSVVGGVLGLSLLSKMTGTMQSTINFTEEGKNRMATSDQDKNAVISLMHISEAIAYLKIAAVKGGGNANTLADAQKKQKRALKFIHQKCPTLKAKGWQ